MFPFFKANLEKKRGRKGFRVPRLSLDFHGHSHLPWWCWCDEMPPSEASTTRGYPQNFQPLDISTSTSCFHLTRV